MCIVVIPAEDFVPARVLGPIEVSGCLVHRVANADSTVWVHSREPIVLGQLCLKSAVHM